MKLDNFTDEQILTILELARVAMSDAVDDTAYSIANTCLYIDMSDKELIELREKLQEELEHVETAEEKRDQEYVNSSGNICPFCKKCTVSADGGVEVDGGVAYQGITCDSCGASWNDIYRLIGINEIKVGTITA